MSKVAFIFPGQGSQSVGMCKDLYENYACARRTFEEADEALGFSISKLCFEGPEDQLRLQSTEGRKPAGGAQKGRAGVSISGIPAV